MTPARARFAEGTLALLISAECLVNASWRGIMFSPDSVWYVRAGNAVLANHFDVRAMWTGLFDVFYTLLPLLIAMAKAIAPASWPPLIILANTAAIACAGVLTFRLAYRYVGTTAGVVAAAGFVAGVEIIDWSRYILTDSLFLGIVTLATYLMTVALVDGAPQTAFAAGGVLLVAFVTRPTAPQLLAPFAIVLAAMWRVHRGRADGATEMRRLTLLFLAAIPLLLVLAVAVLTVIVRRHTSVPVLQQVIELYRSGVVIAGRPETSSAGGTGFGNLLETLLRRLAAFFSITAKGFSPAHTIAATLYSVPLYTAAAAGVLTLLRQRGARPPREIAAYVALLTACVIWISQALVIIDFDWRYRLPAMPPLLLLASLGVTSLLEATRHFWRRHVVPSRKS